MAPPDGKSTNKSRSTDFFIRIPRNAVIVVPVVLVAVVALVTLYHYTKKDTRRFRRRFGGLVKHRMRKVMGRGELHIPLHQTGIDGRRARGGRDVEAAAGDSRAVSDDSDQVAAAEGAVVLNNNNNGGLPGGSLTWSSHQDSNEINNGGLPGGSWSTVQQWSSFHPDSNDNDIGEGPSGTNPGATSEYSTGTGLDIELQVFSGNAPEPGPVPQPQHGGDWQLFGDSGAASMSERGPGDVVDEVPEIRVEEVPESRVDMVAIVVEQTMATEAQTTAKTSEGEVTAPPQPDLQQFPQIEQVVTEAAGVHEVQFEGPAITAELPLAEITETTSEVSQVDTAEAEKPTDTPTQADAAGDIPEEQETQVEGADSLPTTTHITSEIAAETTGEDAALLVQADEARNVTEDEDDEVGGIEIDAEPPLPATNEDGIEEAQEIKVEETTVTAELQNPSEPQIPAELPVPTEAEHASEPAEEQHPAEEASTTTALPPPDADATHTEPPPPEEPAATQNTESTDIAEEPAAEPEVNEDEAAGAKDEDDDDNETGSEGEEDSDDASGDEEDDLDLDAMIVVAQPSAPAATEGEEEDLDIDLLAVGAQPSARVQYVANEFFDILTGIAPSPRTETAAQAPTTVNEQRETGILDTLPSRTEPIHVDEWIEAAIVTVTIAGNELNEIMALNMAKMATSRIVETVEEDDDIGTEVSKGGADAANSDEVREPVEESEAVANYRRRYGQAGGASAAAETKDEEGKQPAGPATVKTYIRRESFAAVLMKKQAKAGSDSSPDSLHSAESDSSEGDEGLMPQARINVAKKMKAALERRVEKRMWREGMKVIKAQAATQGPFKLEPPPPPRDATSPDAKGESEVSRLAKNSSSNAKIDAYARSMYKQLHFERPRAARRGSITITPRPPSANITRARAGSLTAPNLNIQGFFDLAPPEGRGDHSDNQSTISPGTAQAPDEKKSKGKGKKRQ
ncbi:hypothetical protein DFH27DRAFT_609925 [Peziza echinospora]|nr:hypothetical protein DFH27DRAFT_609925 [Peziza echinospora]